MVRLIAINLLWYKWLIKLVLSPCQTFPHWIQSSTSGPLFSFVLRLFWSSGISGLIMCVALLAYGREELQHGKPESDVYEMKTEMLIEPDFKKAFLDVSFISEKCIYFEMHGAHSTFCQNALWISAISLKLFLHKTYVDRKLSSKSKWKIQSKICGIIIVETHNLNEKIDLVRDNLVKCSEHSSVFYIKKEVRSYHCNVSEKIILLLKGKLFLLQVWLKGLLDGILLSHLWEGILPTMGKYAGPAKLLSHTWVCENNIF